MSLRHAILVLLQDQEASGYDLAREFANSIGLVWNATHQQIYLELGKLNEQHMVSYRQLKLLPFPNPISKFFLKTIWKLRL